MGFKFNALTGELDLVGKSEPGISSYGSKFQYHVASLSSYDKVELISYADEGLRSERISSITMSSLLYPNANIVIDVYYLDVGTMDQRIDKIEISGPIFSPDKIRKIFDYTLIGNRYRLDGTNLEVF